MADGPVATSPGARARGGEALIGSNFNAFEFRRAGDHGDRVNRPNRVKTASSRERPPLLQYLRPVYECKRSRF